MSKPIIQVTNISKQYTIGRRAAYGSLREEIMQAFTAPFRRLGQRAERNAQGDSTIWALKDVSFEVQEGEVVGIIGKNGAGKSTLLKILSRITAPTSGRIEMRGRVASLLEVGTGFHPELTGRENILLNGALLGMTNKEIKSKFDEIVAFSEIEKFLDTPVKRYSSGMYVRLAFAVAAHLEPEILIIDEVLAVGDAQFQKKCLGKMGDVAKGGRTVLFVSHNLGAVQRLCRTGICIEKGKIKVKGAISSVLEAYQKALEGDEINGEKEIEVRNGEVRYVKWQLLNSSAGLKHSCYSRDSCEILFTIKAKRTVQNVYLGFALWDSDGKLILTAGSLDNGGSYLTFKEGIYHMVIKARLPLKSGSYQIDVSLNSTELGQFDRWMAEPKLKILPMQETRLSEKWHGILNEDVNIKVERTHNDTIV